MMIAVAKEGLRLISNISDNLQQIRELLWIQNEKIDEVIRSINLDNGVIDTLIINEELTESEEKEHDKEGNDKLGRIEAKDSKA